MQTINLHDTKTSTYYDQDGHYIEGFLIGTKPNKNKWQVNKLKLGGQVAAFKNTPFIIIPEKIAHKIDAHFHGSTKEETIEGYKTYSHGTIQKILGPHSYNDGTDDFYYTHVTKLNNSKTAAVLQQLGSGTTIPFATSPHIWQEDEISSDLVDNFTAIGIALVDEGAYGDISVINRICNGPQKECHRSLGAANAHCGCCANTDENIAKILSSHFSKAANLSNMSTASDSNSPTQTTTANDAHIILPNINTSNPTVNPQKAITEDKPKDPNQITLTKEQYDTFLKNEQESKQAKKQLEELINEKKIETLNSIFTADHVQDETVRNNLIEKYKSYDNKFVKEFYADITKNVLPSIIEKAKQSAKEETANEIKSKSRGASLLRPEPKVIEQQQEDKSKSASVQNIDEVKLVRKFLFGESN